ncbi:hypothetical protein QBC46DRAFT_462088 [Diplogelasinospora grovesii]|uniref:FAD-binding PCMH-type domain-containing protein n=1 Tax=Diplogelasinospora grovesii TaxID=303347 RepID=A0AAN6MXN6_9PEZI|nr:hypothetical protein QBC46DRAFT_462088 [Diplogelasinospora grovesii]
MATPPNSKSKSSISLSSVVTMVAVAVLALAWNFLYPTITASTAGASKAAAAATCQQLKAALGSIVTLPSDVQQYQTLSEENWSQTAWQTPSCIALPQSTTDVQKLVSVLTKNNVPFAIRSGGHSPNPFDANIDTGVLVSLDSLNQISYDATSQLATIGPGARWDAVYTALDAYDVTVVGGRVMDVGVGGLTLGSGLSYLSDLYGMVCDNVVSFQVVLANATIVEATATSHSDLFWALKGGTNNFGIVTQFKTLTYPIKQVWGGLQSFTLDQIPQILDALQEYQNTPKKDLHANLVLNLGLTNATTVGILLTLVYLQPVERPAAFAPFYKLTPVFDGTQLQTLHQLMSGFPTPPLPRWTWYTNSFQPTSDMMSQLSTLLSTAPEVNQLEALQGMTLVATFQPIDKNVAISGQARAGGNALGLQPITQTWFALDVGWLNANDDAAAYKATASLNSKIEQLAKNENVAVDYIFMNDASDEQDVIASYGKQNVKRLRAVQKIYDPTLVFRRLVPGGQKIPAW